jgi:hypothetical protein
MKLFKNKQEVNKTVSKLLGNVTDYESFWNDYFPKFDFIHRLWLHKVGDRHGFEVKAKEFVYFNVPTFVEFKYDNYKQKIYFENNLYNNGFEGEYDPNNKMHQWLALEIPRNYKVPELTKAELKEIDVKWDIAFNTSDKRLLRDLFGKVSENPMKYFTEYEQSLINDDEALYDKLGLPCDKKTLFYNLFFVTMLDEKRKFDQNPIEYKYQILNRKNDMTNVTPLALTNSLLDSSCNPFISFKAKTIAPPFDTYPLEGYEKQENFPNCCDYHKAILNRVVKWLERFPNCCEPHREMQRIYNFDKEDFKDLPLKILNQSDFTRFHIQKRLESEDWYEDITQYLTWNLFSFGQPNIGYFKYILIVKDYLLEKYEVTKIDENKAKLLIKYIDDSISINPNIEDTGFDMVYETYKKWLEIFPFDIPYFRDIKDEYSKKFPAFDGKLVRNRYTGLVQGKAITKNKLIAYLIQTTKDLLDKIQPRELFRNGIISDITKYNFYLESLNVNNSKIVKAYTEKEFEYVSILELWLKNFESFFKNVEPLLTKIQPNDTTPSVVTPSQIEEREKIEAYTKRSEEIKNAFAEYRFIEYLKTSKGYNESQIIKIESLISENETPFIIALLEEIKYLDHFKKEYCNSKGTERDKKLGAVLKAAPRRIKGNINVLNAKSTESRTDYTSWNFKENVSEIIKGL